MSILCYAPVTQHLVCELCGDGWDDGGMYRCDTCQRVICADCRATVPEDCPNEFCVECAEESK